MILALAAVLDDAAHRRHDARERRRERTVPLYSAVIVRTGLAVVVPQTLDFERT